MAFRIAHLPSSFLPDNLGGTEVYVHHLAEELALRGHESTVVFHGGRPDSELPSAHYEVHHLPPLPSCTRAELYSRSANTLPTGFSDFLDAWRPDMLHFHAFTLGAGLGHAHLARQRGIPYVITYHTPTFSCSRGTLLRDGQEICDGLIGAVRCAGCVLQGQGLPFLLARFLAYSPLSHTLLSDSPWLPRMALPSLFFAGRKSWEEFMHGAARVVACAAWCREVLVRNGVDDNRVSVLRQALPGANRTRLLRLPLPGRRPLRLGFFGRFSKIKGPDLLLEAARRLRHEGLEVVCELLGPIQGNEAHWARRLLAPHRDHAAYLGIRRGPELKTWLGELDLVVIPSRCLETGPLTLLEAWDEGTPVIGVDLGGTAEFLRTDGLEALLFRPENPASLAQAVRQAAAWSSPAPRVTVPGMTELASAMVSLYEAARVTAV